MAVLMVRGAIRVLLDYVDSKEIKGFFLLHDYRFLEELKISMQFAAKVINNAEKRRDKRKHKFKIGSTILKKQSILHRISWLMYAICWTVGVVEVEQKSPKSMKEE